MMRVGDEDDARSLTPLGGDEDFRLGTGLIPLYSRAFCIVKSRLHQFIQLAVTALMVFWVAGFVNFVINNRPCTFSKNPDLLIALLCLPMVVVVCALMLATADFCAGTRRQLASKHEFVAVVRSYPKLCLAMLLPLLAIFGFLLFLDRGFRPWEVLVMMILYYASGLTSLVFPVVVIENKALFKAVHRSLTLADGRLGYVFSSWIIPNIAAGTCLGLVGRRLGKICHSQPPFMVFLGYMFCCVPAALLLPISTAAWFLVYASIRAKKEEFNSAILRSEMARRLQLGVTTRQPDPRLATECTPLGDAAENVTSHGATESFRRRNAPAEHADSPSMLVV